MCALVLFSACARAPSGGNESAAETAPGPPQGIAPLLEQAERLRARRDFDAALALYEQARERTPWNEGIQASVAATYAERAALAWSEGELRSAEADLRRACALDPEDHALCPNLARVLVRRAEVTHNRLEAEALLAEARELAPEVVPDGPPADARLERRLDLAFELLERGQVEAGVERLESLLAEHPLEPSVVRLLAQARVRLAAGLSKRRNFAGAGGELDRAVELYVTTFPECAPPECEREDVRTAHWNRVVAWLNAEQPTPAARALAQAEAHGFLFPKLERVLAGR